jgi:hypothetical protein
MKSLQNVLALVPDCHTPPNYLHLAWRRHIYEGMRPHLRRLIIPEELDFKWARQGHDVDLAPYEKERINRSERLLESIKTAHREHGLDAVFSYCYSFDLVLDVVKETIRMGIPWINFFCDSMHMFEKVEALARLVSLNWFTESAAIPRYKALGVPFLCAPYAWNPDWLPDLANRDVLRSAVFIGFPSSNRITQLGYLRLLGCPVEIRGRGWTGDGPSPFYSPIPARQRFLKAVFQPNFSEKIIRRLVWPLVRPMAHGILSDAEFGGYIKDSLIILGLNQGKDAQGRFTSYLKYRDMEFPGHGCCYLTEDNEDIHQVFEVGKEVLTYKNPFEASARIRHLRKHPEIAREIGRAGRRRILDGHGWNIRLKQIEQSL